MEDIDEEGKALLETICSFLYSALKGASEEIDKQEDLNLDVNWREIAKKHIFKKLNYLETEGFIDSYEEISTEDL